VTGGDTYLPKYGNAYFVAEQEAIMKDTADTTTSTTD
jgi:hypothetical protein